VELLDHSVIFSHFITCSAVLYILHGAGYAVKKCMCIIVCEMVKIILKNILNTKQDMKIGCGEEPISSLFISTLKLQ
jgi:hypothetical protein